MRQRCQIGVVAVLLASLGGACGGGPSTVDESNALGTESAVRVAGRDVPVATTDCSALPRELIVEVSLGYTRVLQLEAENLEFMEETMGLPDPAAFRVFAEAFEQLDTSGIETMQFDTPDMTAAGQRQLADLLEGALAAGDDGGNAAWAELQTYVEENVTRQQLSVSYYVSEAGCV